MDDKSKAQKGFQVMKILKMGCRLWSILMPPSIKLHSFRQTSDPSHIQPLLIMLVSDVAAQSSRSFLLFSWEAFTTVPCFLILDFFLFIMCSLSLVYQALSHVLKLNVEFAFFKQPFLIASVSYRWLSSFTKNLTVLVMVLLSHCETDYEQGSALAVCPRREPAAPFFHVVNPVPSVELSS